MSTHPAENSRNRAEERVSVRVVSPFIVSEPGREGREAQPGESVRVERWLALDLIARGLAAVGCHELN